MVRTTPAGANSQVDVGLVAQRDSVGNTSAVHGLAAFLAASCAWNAAGRRARDTGSNPATAGIRSAGECVGTADFAAARSRLRSESARPALPDGRGRMGPAFAASGNAGDGGGREATRDSNQRGADHILCTRRHGLDDSSTRD